jgi:hypothetical protein
MYYKMGQSWAYALLGLSMTALYAFFASYIWTALSFKPIFGVLIIFTLWSFGGVLAWEWHVRKFRSHFTRIYSLPTDQYREQAWLEEALLLAQAEVDAYGARIQAGPGDPYVYLAKVKAALRLGIRVQYNRQFLPIGIEYV